VGVKRSPLTWFVLQRPSSETRAHPRLCAVGIEFATLFASSGQAIQHYIVEHDNPADPFESLAASYR
jgi:hypothetical protein